MRLAWAAAPLLGAATALGFAPFGQHLLPFLTLALLFLLWRRAPGPLAVAGLGFAWGLGFFLAGVSWVYVSLHDVGGMAAPLAAIATLLFCAYLALYPALAGYLFGRWRSGTALRDAALAAGAWALADWLRGWVLTGFPWLAIGYSQVPDGLLAGFSPLLGVYGVGLLLAFGAGLLAFAGRRLLPLGLAAALAAAGVGLRGLGWTDPVGEPLSVSLVQGNIPQSIKWEPDRVFVSIDAYTRLVADHPARLTVLPETAIPLIFDRIPREALQGLIPMSDFTAGPPGQPPLEVADQKLMPNICYEDLFGAEILRALPAATVLVNLSNTAWFGDSLAQPQHLQISQARALETGRPMLRATNTGMTASVLPNGRVAAVLPAFTAGALRVDVQGHTGRTPYAQVGDRLAVVLALLACLPAARRSRRGAGSL